jgi:hypothetical protein
MMTHFGDPCIHCGIPHDDVAPGACTGDPKKVRPIAYRSLGVRWDNVEHFRILFSDNHIEERWCHISEHAPYFHFGYSDDLIQPPRYHPTLRRPQS